MGKNFELAEFRTAYFDVVVEEHDLCKPKETVLPEGHRWVKYDPSVGIGQKANGSAAGKKSRKDKRGS